MKSEGNEKNDKIADPDLIKAVQMNKDNRIVGDAQFKEEKFDQPTPIKDELPNLRRPSLTEVHSNVQETKNDSDDKNEPSAADIDNIQEAEEQRLHNVCAISCNDVPQIQQSDGLSPPESSLTIHISPAKLTKTPQKDMLTGIPVIHPINASFLKQSDVEMVSSLSSVTDHSMVWYMKYTQHEAMPVHVGPTWPSEVHVMFISTLAHYIYCLLKYE